VNEPTAGLDPRERNRFYNLLAEIGEQVIVILSTHIVEDVMDLCTNMAIIQKGQVLYQGSPQDAIAQLKWANLANLHRQNRTGRLRAALPGGFQQAGRRTPSSPCL
jgi:ABC-type multidrug transport system ATPase subunit